MTSERPTAATDYAALTPDVLLTAIEDCGFCPDGRMLALNSYENRVYQIGIDDSTPLIAKFYRPGRWTNATILEEHAFALELAAQEIPVVAPLAMNAATLHQFKGFRFALFPRQGGHWPELNTRDDRLWMGRFIGRIHAVGSSGRFLHRPALDIDSFGHQSRRVPARGWVHPRTCRSCVPHTDRRFTAAGYRHVYGSRQYPPATPAW